MTYLLNPSILSPQFITDGLILHLDAATSTSYPGSGTVWTDLSTSGYNYNVHQSTYRAISPKYFAFQPENGGIAKSQNITNPAAPASYTVMVWTRVRNSSSDWRTLMRPYNNDHHVLNLNGGWTMGAYDNDEGGGFLSSGFDQRNLANYPEWVCLHFKFSRETAPNWQMSWNDSAGTTRASINDVRACPPTILGNLGGWGNGTASPADFSQAWGDIGAFYMWNRHLTVEEQNQNYELTKSRYDKAIVTSGLVAALDFSNTASYNGTGTTVFDISGRSNNATLTNSPSYSSDASGSLTLNGSNQMITGVHNSDVEIIGDLTIDAWFKLEADPGDWVRVIGKGNESSRTYGLWYNKAASYFLYQRYGSSNMNVLYTSTVNIGTWYHLTGVTTGTTNELYLNGSLVGTTIGGSATYATSTEPYTLGKHPQVHAYHNGKIGEGRIYNRGLTAPEVLKNYNATKSRYGL
jgi:hypothetical protein